MRLLLDTHIVLWSLLEPGRLSPEVRQHLGDPGNELWISPISVWEMAVLAEKGRVLIDAPDPTVWIRDMLSRAPLREATLTHEVALQSRCVNLGHQDPADRFIAATAMVYDLVLVTADRRLLAAALLQTMAS
ncbi:MAG: type II toxin-antitoxin system VapC family toxin [Candidatus Latescibacterota bacterium]|jgi:PIN domain nuclease of toxin-antitoxin system